MAFGDANMKDLLPPYDLIPIEFKRGHTKWNKIQSTWFFSGLPKGTQFIPVDGVDKSIAIRHLGAIQGSFEPKHEHKSAAVSWLMSLWFKEIIIPTA